MTEIRVVLIIFFFSIVSFVYYVLSISRLLTKENFEQISEENEVMRISHPTPPHEETVTESNQEDKLLDSPKREDETIAEPYEGEKSATLDTQSDEIPHEEVRI